MGTSIINSRVYDSVYSFLSELSYNGEIYNLMKGGWAFRGHSKAEYKLLPSALRETFRNSYGEIYIQNDAEGGQILKEYYDLSNFFNICDKSGLRLPINERMRRNLYKYFDDGALQISEWIPEDVREIAALAQHYGIKTRLLDWTDDLFVALYFALSGLIKEDFVNGRIAIWAIDTKQLVTAQNIIPLRIFRPPYGGNPNLSAQKGLFTLWNVKNPISMVSGQLNLDFSVQTNRQPLEVLISNALKDGGYKNLMYKIEITIKDSEELKDAYFYLNSFNINASTIFPGYAGSAKCHYEERMVLDIFNNNKSKKTSDK